MEKCTICEKQTTDLRLGACFTCANAESIIHDGTDMYDNDINGKKRNETEYTAMEKLKFLISEGWVNSKNI